MKTFQQFVETVGSAAVVESIGWLLFHSLWQFTLLAMAALLLVRLVRGSAAIRYRVLAGTLILIVLAPAGTWLAISRGESRAPATGSQRTRAVAAPVAQPREPTTDAPHGQRGGEAGGVAAVSGPLSLPSERDRAVGLADAWLTEGARPIAAATIRPWLPVIVVIWGCGVLLFSVRPVWSGMTVRRIRRVGTSPVAAAVQQALARVRRRLQLERRVEVLASSLVNAPVVVGCFHSVILLPASFISSLPVAQLESILAHELAHVRRYDYVANLAQALVETLFFYHPAVWWLSHRIRVEREHCCDDMVVAALGNPQEYGRALLAVAEYRGTLPALGLGVHGGSLLARVRRVLGCPDVASTSPALGSAAVLGVLAIALTLGIWAGLRGASDELERLTAMPTPGRTEWPMGGGAPSRNQVSPATDVPTEWDAEDGRNIKWTTDLGTACYSSPVVASGKVLIGTNNGKGRLARFPAKVDLACLQCFDQQTGQFLWQYSSAKLPNQNFDWPQLGLCSTPCVVGNRVWLTTNRCEVVCLDLNGFRDGENDGPVTDEASEALSEADVVWRFDMLGQLGISPMYQACSSPTIIGDLLLLNTANASDNSQGRALAPAAPSFLALNRHTGQVVWQDSSPGANVLGARCPTSSPAVAEIDGTVQAIFGGGDGWVYAFDARAMHRGRTQLLWKFDINPKLAKFRRTGRGDRNMVMASPVVWENKVYVVAGADPEWGEDDGILWCLDPRKRGDISEELVFNQTDPHRPILPKRHQACEPAKGDFTRPNPESGVIWKYSAKDLNRDGEVDFHETVHRSCGSPVIARGLLFLADYSGLLHCFDARTGHRHWHSDLLAHVTATSVIADGKLYVVDEEGDVSVFECSHQKTLLGEIPSPAGVFGTPAVVTGELYLGTQRQLIAVGKPDAKSHAAANSRSAATERPLRTGPTKELPDSLNVMAIGFDRDQRLWSIATRRTLTSRRWNLETGELQVERTLESNQHANRYLSGELSLSPDCTRTMAIHDGGIQIWDTASGKLVTQLKSDANSSLKMHRGLSCAADFSRVACGSMEFSSLSRDPQAAVWDVAGERVIRTVTHTDGVQITSTALSPNGRWLATGSQEAGLCLWDINTGELLHRFPNKNAGRQHPDAEVSIESASQVVSVRFAPDSRRIALGDMLGVKILDVPSGQLIREFAAPFRMGRSGLEFSGDGKLLARVAADNTVLIWSAQTGKLVAALPSQSHRGSFSADGKWFAIGLTDAAKGIRAWQIEALLPGEPRESRE